MVWHWNNLGVAIYKGCLGVGCDTLPSPSSNDKVKSQIFMALLNNNRPQWGDIQILGGRRGGNLIPDSMCCYREGMLPGFR